MSRPFSDLRVIHRNGGHSRSRRVSAGQRSVLVVSDSPFLRADFERVLALGPEVMSAGTAGLGEAAEQARLWCPDIVLLDGSVAPVPSALVQQLRGLDDPPLVVLLVSRRAELPELEHADVVLAAESGVPAIVQSLRLVAAGVVVAVRRSPRVPSLDAEMRQRLSSLTEREHEVLLLIVGGLSNREVGARLFISLDTVKEHVSRILTKLQVASRIEAAVAAVRAEHTQRSA